VIVRFSMLEAELASGEVEPRCGLQAGGLTAQIGRLHGELQRQGIGGTGGRQPRIGRKMARDDIPGIEPVQFALAGMNAHINHDLPLALVSTCEALATTPDTDPHFADYQKVDQLLDGAEQAVRESFETAAELAVDRHLAAVADLLGNWTINDARDLAWTNCLLLWAVRDNPIARGLFLDTLAASTALASRLLLVAV